MLIVLDARALFERAVSAIPGEQTAALWDEFLQFERRYGELGTIVRMEKRMGELFQNGMLKTNSNNSIFRNI